MNGIRQASKADQAKAAKAAVDRLIEGAFEPALTEIDETNGTYSVDGINFSFSDGKLVMLVFCDRCKQEVPSKPIRRLADIEDNLNIPKPGRHICGDA